MDQFDELDNATMVCAVCEAMCPEAVDGTLTAAEQKAFDKHVAGCVACGKELEEAHRGAAWMAMLKGHAPEPPAALLQRILAETTGTAAGAEVLASQVSEARPVAPLFVPEWENARPISTKPSRLTAQWASFRAKLDDVFSMQRMTFQPRLAMTAAMAFFSIALTLNMAGVRLNDLRGDMLRPSVLRRTVADASASATRSFQNLRVVYEFESRVSDLRNNGGLGGRFNNDDEKDPAGPFQNEPANQKETEPGNGNGTAAPGNTTDQNKQEKSVPQGKSELMFPLKPSTPAEKGA